MKRPEKKPMELRGFPRSLMNRAVFGPYPGSIVWIDDGDSLRGLIDYGGRNYKLEDLRLLGVAAPDAGKEGATAEDEAFWRRRLAELLGFDLAAADAGEFVRVFCLIHTTAKEDKYGRRLCLIEREDGKLINEILEKELEVWRESAWR